MEKYKVILEHTNDNSQHTIEVEAEDHVEAEYLAIEKLKSKLNISSTDFNIISFSTV